MIRKIIAVLILVPLMIAIVALALVNRHGVPIVIDPFSAGDLTAALQVQVPLFVLVFGLVAGGVVIGGVAAWLNQGKWRRAARRAEWELGAAKAENAELKQRVTDAEDEGRRWPPRALQRPAA